MGTKFNRHQVNNHQTPLKRDSDRKRGPVHNGGQRGTYDFNSTSKPYEQQTPWERQQQGR